LVNNGFTFIDLTSYGGANNSNAIIDEYVVTTTGTFEYVALDAMKWEYDCSGLVAPTANAQNFCDAATVANLVATGNSLKWYADATGGSALIGTTALTTKTYYVTSSSIGCESARISVSVTITPSSDNVTKVSACDSYFWNGTTYTTSGIKTGPTANCVTEKLDLTITPSSDNVTIVSACDSYFWNGTTYTTSGIKTGPTANCVTEKLDLTITPSSDNVTIVSACDSYFWNGTTYTTSGIKTGPTTNCVTEKLDLTITPSSDNVTIVSACDSYFWNGTTYTTSGIKTGPTANCVTEKLDLTITPSSDNVTIISACDSYFWNGTTYTTSGIKTGPTANCVTEKLDLTINTTIAPTGNATQTFCGSETVSLLNATGTGIIWYDAATIGTVVPGATVLVDGTTYYASQTVSGCESSARLAVTVNSGGCLGLDNFDAANLQWYPNPTKGILNITYSKNIEEISVINLLGQTLFTNKPKANEVRLDLSKLTTDTYFVKVVSEGKSKMIKVIKQ
jgi:uncharacterized protein with PIN domain